MLSVLNKVDKLRQKSGGEKVESLAPPKNLPDLARDIYERDPKIVSTEADKAGANVQSFAATSNISNFSRQPAPVNEPNKDSVPGLDMSLVRQHLAASQSAIQSVQPQQPIRVSQPIQQSVPNSIQQPITQQVINPVTQLTSQLITPTQSPSMVSQSILQSLPHDANVADDTGFFKEFEEYVRNNGLNNDIISDLLDKNLLEHMMFYHTTKGEDMPFYASGAELSHAIKVKLEELQNFERNWISNKQKVDLLKKWSSTIESDIHLRSEELKKLMAESRRRGNVNNRTPDFFQMEKDTSAKINSINTQDNAANVVSTNIPLTPTIAPSIYRPTPQVSSSSSINPYQTPIINTPKSPVINPVSQPVISQQSVLASKYALNNYVAHDPSKHFYCVDGQVFKSLYDLMNGLDNMSRDVFNHHVNNSKNDFASWIKGVFGDFRLADSIRSQNDREGLWYFLKNNTY